MTSPTLAGQRARAGNTGPSKPVAPAVPSLYAERFSAALTARITDPVIRALPTIGTVYQFIDSTDVLNHPELARTATHAVVHASKR